ncbi:MAG TPA: RNA polymerase-binding protein DksA [Steroidobacteraceae bacterium]|nr:RNA polymerase-binding protein DksA [Steroidobacteraceae bacterium]
MAAKKSAPKTAKVKKPAARATHAAAKAAPKKTAPADRKPAPKVAVPPPRKLPAKPAPTPEKKSTPATPATPAPAPVRLEPRRPDVQAEDGDAAESLLAGPRNVQAYVLKRGEQYMSKDQLEHFRRILQSWKQDLMMEVDRTVSHMKDEAANFPDPNDRATQEEEFSLELRTRDRERKLIRKIDEALQRIEDGSYGYCLETGEPIGVKRLEARPVATLSLEAQERRERREKQYGDRDDRYR